MLRIGVLGTANIAERRMIPAIIKNPDTEYVGVAIATKEEVDINLSDDEFISIENKKKQRADYFSSIFGGETVIGYETMLRRDDIDAVYIPLPPALHFKWIMLALKYGKHVISEKPLTINKDQSEKVVSYAREQGLALIENYCFCFHKQMIRIQELIEQKSIGELRHIRAAFCFPHREESDFRYDKKMGGGALLDCGGYTIKAALTILGTTAKVVCSNLKITPDHDVDVYGSATIRNDDGICAQLSFGMDNSYICELEIWGSKGSITAARIFTAPDGFDAPVLLKTGNDTKEMFISDDQFGQVLNEFLKCVFNQERREKEYSDMAFQSSLVAMTEEKAV